jgi:hypothetical protein
MDPGDFIACALSNQANAALLSRLPALGLSECYLTAGCLFQAVWNKASGRAADWGIKDYDVLYFDDRDLSWEAEDAVIRRVDAMTADLGIKVEPRNQARVHLWYQKRFGFPCSPLTSARDGIDRYLIACLDDDPVHHGLNPGDGHAHEQNAHLAAGRVSQRFIDCVVRHAQDVGESAKRFAAADRRVPRGPCGEFRAGRGRSVGPWHGRRGACVAGEDGDDAMGDAADMFHHRLKPIRGLAVQREPAVLTQLPAAAALRQGFPEDRQIKVQSLLGRFLLRFRHDQ